MGNFRKKRRTMRHYDQLSRVYDAQYAKEQKAKINATLNNLKLGQNELILDVGCGTGLLFEHVTDSAGLLVGVDASSKILKEAQKRARLLLNVVIVRADVDCTPFQNQVFHSIFAITILQNMPNPLRTLQEMKRVSRPGSRIIVTGLRKKFTKECFINLLIEAELDVSTLTMDSQMKEHVAICRIRKKTLEKSIGSVTFYKQNPYARNAKSRILEIQDISSASLVVGNYARLKPISKSLKWFKRILWMVMNLQ